MSRLIKKLIFWFVDVGTILLTFFMVRSEWLIWKDRATFSWYIGMVVIIYIISVIELIVMRIFNFIHKFDDYDGFGDFLKHLLQGPLALIIMTIYHFIQISSCIYGLIRRKINPNWTNVSSYKMYHNSDNFVQKTSPKEHEVTNKNDNDDNRKAIGANHLESKIYDILTSRYGSWDRTIYGFSVKITSFHIRVDSMANRCIYVNAKASIDVDNSIDNEGDAISINLHMEDYLKSKRIEIRSIATDALKSEKGNYKDLDRISNNSVEVSLTPEL